jgi:formylglycine-generating enzyme required for sulfatase activity
MANDHTVNPVQLGKAIAQQFDLAEIEELCFELNYEYENLGEGGRTSKAIQLVKAFERRGALLDLAGGVITARPNVITWAELGRADLTDAYQEAGQPPYKGLAHFDVNDFDHFYGRDDVTADLIQSLHQHNFLAVVGASGSGKSSVVRAGLIPALQGKKQLESVLLPVGSSDWPVHILTPTDSPLLSLATALSSSVEEAMRMRDLYAEKAEGLHTHGRFLLQKSGSKKLLLFVDQFEELFTQCKDKTERQAFVDNLITAAQGSVIVIITLRADFYARCAQYDNLRYILSNQQIYLGPMNKKELRQAVELPATRYGWKFEAGLVDLLLEDIGDEPGALPLMSHALLETWQRREGVTMTLTGYVASGGIRGAIAETAESVFQQRLTPEQQPIARAIFLRLTELGEGTQDTRRRASFSELITRATNEDVIDTVLNILTDARLVIVDLADDFGEKTIEVTHEALIREWPTLREWLDKSRDDLRQHRQITADTHNWVRYQQDAGLLYRGVRLGNALKWMADNVQNMSRLERQFIEASHHAVLAEKRAKEEAQQRELQMAQDLAASQGQAAQRLRGLVVALGGAAILMVAVIAILATPIIQESRAKTQAQGKTVSFAAGPVTFGSDDDSLIGATFFREAPAITLSTLPAYELDAFEVSNAQYALCTEHGDCTVPLDQTTFQDVDKANYPVTYVTVFQANAFCNWIGRRLPTELEWVKAVRGRENGRNWPNNAPPTPLTANMPFNGTATFSSTQAISGTQPVTSFANGASTEGVYNLIGNVWEWTASYYQEAYDFGGEYDMTQLWNGKPETFQGSNAFVVRGGGWEFGIDRATTWNAFAGTTASAEIGFRCAADG